MKQDNYADPDDMFSDTRMTFGEHIEDLRTHLMRAIKGFILGMLVSIFLAGPILNFIIAPVDRELEAYYRRFYAKREKELAEEFAMNRGNVPLLVERIMIRWPNREFAPKKLDEDKAVLPQMVPAIIKHLDLDAFVNPLIINAGDWVEAEVVKPDIAKSAKNAQ